MRQFAGTGRLIRLALRLDRLRLSIWVVSMGVLTYATASAFRELYPTVASRTAFAGTLQNTPALVALTGPPYNLRTIGGLTAWRIGGFGAVMVAMLAVFTVVRHTRAEEESGRVELVGAAAVGRLAPLTAAILVSCGATFTVGMMVAAGLAALGQPATGAIALGTGFASVGWLFAGVAGVASQLASSSRAANGIAGAALGVAFGLRAIGDSGGPSWLSWLSPIGWSQRLRPFAGERWEVMGLFAGAWLLAAASAYALAVRRDLGSGLLPASPGPEQAGRLLNGPFGLAARLHRGSTAGWVVSVAVMGAAFGTMAESIGGLLEDNPQLRQIFEAMGGPQNLTDAFFASTMGVLGLLAGAYAVEGTLTLRSEESSLRAEALLANRLDRTRWFSSHLLVVAAGSVIVLGVGGLTAGLVHGLRTGDVAGPVGKLLAGGLIQLPAVLVLAGFTALLFGALPRWSHAAWGAVAFSAVLAQLGPILRLDQWIVNFSPFGHSPQIPGEPVKPLPLVLLSATSLLLAAGGLAAFRRRDVG